MKSDLWPKGYIIGTLKAATTSLHAFLSYSDAFYVPERKYLRYFAREVHPTFCLEGSEDKHRQMYLREFDGMRPGQIGIDCENMTILNPWAPERIFRVRPDAKIVAVLRDPIERAWSHYLSNFERGMEPRTPKEAMLTAPKAFPGMIVPDRYVEAGLYFYLLSRFLEWFERTNILLVDYEDIRDRPAEVEQQLYDFFAVPCRIKRPLVEIRINQTLVARNPLSRFLHRMRHRKSGIYLRTRMPWMAQFLTNERLFKRTDNEAMPDDLCRALADAFAWDASQLQSVFGFNTAKWMARWRARIPDNGKARRNPNRVRAPQALLWRSGQAVVDLVDRSPFRSFAPNGSSVEDLRSSLNRLGIGGENQAAAQKLWAQNAMELRELVDRGEPQRFLEWPLIRRTMFYDNPGGVRRELHYLRGNSAWRGRWRPAIVENRMGSPRRYVLYQNSSGNLIHHAYHIARFEAAIAGVINRYSFVVEFGAGYGSMCRLFRNLGFGGDYLLFDLPHFSSLQRFFLSETERERNSVRSGSMLRPDFVTSLGELRHKVQLLGKKPGLLIGTWSISETSKELRDQVMNSLLPSMDCLLASQDRFCEMDNRAYFEGFCGHDSAIRNWRWEGIPHMPDSFYLFGFARRKGLPEFATTTKAEPPALM